MTLDAISSSIATMNSQSISRKVWRNPWYFIAFGFGSGLLPVMPGTYGTIVAVPLYLFLTSLGWTWYAVVTIVFTAFSMWLSGWVCDDLKVHDYPGVNIDEIVGYLVTMFLVPVGWMWMLAGFALFRLFDIWKPWPIGWVDKHVHGGFGIIFDDILAGALSWLVLQLAALGLGLSLLF